MMPPDARRPFPEHQFATLRDLHHVLAELIDSGMGDLPFQIVVAPDSTIQALARQAGAIDDAKPVLMLDYEAPGGKAVPFICAERLGNAAPRSAIQ